MKFISLIYIVFITISISSAFANEIQPPQYLFIQFIKQNSSPEKGDIEVVKKENIYYKQIDANGDDQPDWYLDDPNSCGSQGCNGSIYIYYKTKYCYSGPESRMSAGKIINTELECKY